MLFSVIIPVFNKSQYLEPCINSFLEYDTNLYELVFVDDSSDDDSVQKLYSILDDRKCNFKIVRHEVNQGTFKARETGIAQAEGDYVLLLDPDDEIAPSGLVKLEKALKQSEAELLIYDLVLKYENRSVVEKSFRGLKTGETREINGARDFLRVNPVCRGAGGKVIKRSTAVRALSMISGDTSNYINSEDFLFILLVSSLSHSTFLYSEPLYIYNKAVEGSSTSERYDLALRLYLQNSKLISVLDKFILEHKKSLKPAQLKALNTARRSRSALREIIIRKDPYALSKLNKNYFSCMLEASLTFSSIKAVVGLFTYLISLRLIKL